MFIRALKDFLIFFYHGSAYPNLSTCKYELGYDEKKLKVSKFVFSRLCRKKLSNQERVNALQQDTSGVGAPGGTIQS